MPFLFLFILWPVLEITAFFGVADEIGLLMAIALIILAGICGSFLLRYQSWQTFMSAGDSVRNGRLPSQKLFDAACIIGASILLIIPGFISDGIAVLLLIAPFRARFRDILKKRSGLKPGDVIEVDFERVEEDNTPITKKDDVNE